MPSLIHIENLSQENTSDLLTVSASITQYALEPSHPKDVGMTSLAYLLLA